MENNYEVLRQKMVEEQIKKRGIKSVAVLEAMQLTPRHLFVPENIQDYAYKDCALPIGLDQTISQPYIVAYMTEFLDPTHGMKILEIGTGSGYQTAVLAHLGAVVYSIELLEELSSRAGKTITSLNLNNVKIKCGNGFSGWPEEAPFDAVIVTAAPARVPSKLIEQLKEGGKMIIPIGPVNSIQQLKIITKKEKGFIENDLLSVRFVPMLDI
jgi:protein-L-isoaspartate(D-aspartate) O-methyltransferase